MSSEGDNRRTALPEVTASPIEGRKDDAGKLRFDLLPRMPIVEVVRVLTDGAKVYSPHNWKAVENPRERYLAALERHLHARFPDEEHLGRGERLDEKSGLAHLAHAVCDLLFLLWFDMQEPLTTEQLRRTYGDSTSAHLRAGERDHA